MKNKSQRSVSPHWQTMLVAGMLALLLVPATTVQAGATTYVCATDFDPPKLSIDDVKLTASDGQQTIKTRRLKDHRIQWGSNGFACTLDPKASTLFCESTAGAAEFKCTTLAPQ